MQLFWIVLAACIGLVQAQVGDPPMAVAPADSQKAGQTAPEAGAVIMETPVPEAGTPAGGEKPAAVKETFVPGVGSRENAGKEVVFPQDPRLSAFLSVTFPGLGQLYEGRYLPAALFMGAFAASSGVIAYYANENRERSAEIIRFHDVDGNLVEMKRYPELEVGQSELSTAEKAANISAFVAVGVSYFWSVIDAYRSAKAFNRAHFAASGADPRIRMSVKPVQGAPGLEVAVRF